MKHLVIEGYDHVIDVHDDETIVAIAYSRGHEELGAFLESIPTFEVCSIDSLINFELPIEYNPLFMFIR